MPDGVIPVKSQTYVRGNNPYGFNHESFHYYFLGSEENNNFSVSGNIMALIDNGTETATTIPCDNCYCSLFHNSYGLISAEELRLPATSLKSYSYESMFMNCLNLLSAPLILPALNLANHCYENMFAGCSSLINASQLPAMNLKPHCYKGMFSSSGLKTAPSLPAEELCEHCYDCMFLSCKELNYVKVGFTSWKDELSATSS